MDLLFLPVVLFIVFIVLCCICNWCRKKHREDIMDGVQATVTVTSQPAPSAILPYPVQLLPPQGFAPTSGYQAGPYPISTTSYPAPPEGAYPPPSGLYPVPNSAPYLPTTTSNPPQELPPSYMEAVGQSPAEPLPPIN